MKINEKHLATIASLPIQVDKEGYLVKKSGSDVNKVYQKRWFVLKGNLLFYFEKKGDKEPLGVIILEGHTIESEEDGQLIFKIVFHGKGNRQYILEADSQESMEQWMKILVCCSFDYITFMVKHLQHQITEMEANKIKHSQNKDGILMPAPPIPPTRRRHNPFNKTPPPGNINSNSSEQYATSDHSPRNSSYVRPEHKKITFRELHTLYGRQILMDYNEWRNRKKELEKPLIEL